MNFTEITQLATAIGVGLTFIAAVVGIRYNTNRARQSKYVDTITSERIKWLEKIRNEVADLTIELEEFFVLKYHKLKVEYPNDPVNTDRIEEYIKILKSDSSVSNSLAEISKPNLKRKIQILKLRLNRNEEKVIMEKLDFLLLQISYKSTLDDIEKCLTILSEFIPAFQTILKQEWEKAKREART